MMDVLVRWLCVAVVGFAPGVRAQEESEPEEQEKQNVKVSPCEFDGAGPESRGRLSESETRTCGATGLCIASWTMNLGLEGEKPLVEVMLESDLVPGEIEAPRLGVECSPGGVTLRGTGRKESAVGLEYRDDRFLFAPVFLEALERAWTSPPNEPWGIESLTELEPVLETLRGVDPGPLQSVRLLQAREHLRAERWDSAESHLAGLEQEYLPTELKARRLALVDELQRVRARTVPLRVTAWKRLGRVLGIPRLPPWTEGELPTLFWQGTRLCSAQEDVSPPQYMRCYETKTGKWSARLPFALSPHAPAGIYSNYGGRACLYTDDCWSQELPPLEGCGGFTCGGVLALAPGPVVLVAGSSGLYAYTRQGERSLAENEASLLVRKSLGARLAGGARYMWGPGGKLRPVTNTEKSWSVLGMSPPPDKTVEGPSSWVGSPLASPDQEWVLGVAHVKTGPPVLWLGKLEPVAHPKSP